MPHTVAGVVGVRETADQSTLGALASRLRARRLLLVLDNCEHLLDASAQLVDALLRGCEDVRVLATSRETLSISGELAWRVPSLPVPDPRHLPPLAELGCNPAVQLFVDRASAATPQFALSERNAPTVVQVCARLDGIPLALELAARMAALSVDQLAARLNQRFRLLTGGSRAALPRQQTLRATLDWSYDLLSEPERRLINRVSVFAGGWTLEAAEAVCGGDAIEPDDVLDLLARLVSKSLVIAELDPDGIERYVLLETVRQYTRERLVAAGEAEQVHQRHANYFLEFVEAFGPNQLLQGASPPVPTDVGLLDELERERDNLRTALRWWIDSGDAGRAVRQAAGVFPIWMLRGSSTEGRAWIAELLTLPAAVNSPDIRRRALPMLASQARRHGEYALALDTYQQLLDLERATGNRYGAASALAHLANVHYLRADYPSALVCLDASRATAGDLTDGDLSGFLSFVGGQVALHEGRYEQARSLLTDVLDRDHSRDTQSTALRTGYRVMNLGIVAREQGELAEAGGHLGRALEVAEVYGDQALLAHVLEGFSGLASALGQHERALRLGSAAAAPREAIGAPLPPAWRRIVDRWLAVSRAALGEEAANSAWKQGRVLPLQAAVRRGRIERAASVFDNTISLSRVATVDTECGSGDV